MPKTSELWPEGPNHAGWCGSTVSAKILGEKEEGRGLPIPVAWTRLCAQRLQEMRTELHRSWVGLELAGDHLIDWVLAALIARENVLLLGEPGVAKTQIAERTFRLLGLEVPQVKDVPPVPAESHDFSAWWERREGEEREKQKYFRYLLSRFTQPEELFGPIEISLLRRGLLVHVNFGLLTGPGVRAAFLDEIFKASSSILNALLTLVLEREYFNWGGMRRSDLTMLIGASNELPGGFASGHGPLGSGAEDFNTLYAFLDRFPIRLQIPNASGSNIETEAEKSHLAEAARTAIRRAAEQFTRHDAFSPVTWTKGAPCVNDLLLLGRAMLEQDAQVSEGLFDHRQLARFNTAFCRIAATLQKDGTGVREGIVSWSVSPRKLMALYKIALAHALVRDVAFAGGSARVVGPDAVDLRVFTWVWDTPGRRDELARLVEAGIRRHFAQAA